MALRYLGNTGAEYSATVEMGKMRTNDYTLQSTIELVLQQGARWADKNARTKIADIRANLGGGSINGWLERSQRDYYTFFALGRYYLGIAGKTWCTDGKIRFQYHWRIDDVYDFDNTNDSATPFSKDRDWHRMARLGWAKPFRISGKRQGSKLWTKGKPPSTIKAP